MGDTAACAGLKTGALEAATLASADIDEDGVPDLVVTYASATGGAISVTSGNLRAVYPHAPLPAGAGDPGDAPFVGPARMVATPVSADLSVAGDFDGDRHQDVLVAQKGGSSLVLFSGDGKGALKHSRTVETGGAITTIAAGEIDTPDGTADVAVGVTGSGGNRVLLYPSKTHGLSGKPEAFKVAAAPTSMAIGRLAANEQPGVVIAAGASLTFVHAHDDANRKVDRRQLDFSVEAIALGGFAHPGHVEISLVGVDGRIRLAEPPSDGVAAGLRDMAIHGIAQGTVAAGGSLVAANATSRPGDDLVLVDGASRRISIREASQDQTASADLDVSSAPVAVLPMRLNSDGMDDLVVLRKGSTEPSFIVSRPRLTFTVTTNAAMGAGSLADAITQANGSSGPDMIDFALPGSTLIQPTVGFVPSEAVTIDATTQTGYAGTPIVTLDGTSASVNTQSFDVVVASGVVIRGFSIINWMGDGIVITAGASATTIEANYIGVTTSGTTAAGNGASGVTIIDSSANVVGGTTTAARNVISGNGAQGIHISSFMSNGNMVLGNYIGTNAAGTAALSNTFNGVEIEDAASNTVGGTAVGAGNVISGNTASTTLSNGVYVHGFSAFGLIQGNIIGLAADGATPLANGANGVLDDASQLAINGLNIISGNTGNGILCLSSGSGIWATDNYIGTDSSGLLDAGNTLAGVYIQDVPNGTVGDLGFATGNTISGNDGGGVVVAGSSFSIFIGGNLIGTDPIGNTTIGNGGNGILVSDFSMADIVANRVFGSSANGIAITDSASCALESNSCYFNLELGIDLGNDDVTMNDPGDTDPGPDGLQNFPVITSASYDGLLHFTGTLNSAPSQDYRIEFFVSPTCELSGFGEGYYPAGTVDTTTGLGGDAFFSLDVFPNGFSISPGEVVTATASPLLPPPGRSGRPGRPATQVNVPMDTSEFSACVPLITPNGPDLSVTISGVPNPVVQGNDVTYTIDVTNPDLKSIATSVQLSGTTPAGMTFQSLSAPGGWSTTDPGPGGTGAFTASTAMLFFGTTTFTLVLRVDPGVPDNTDIDTTVTLTQADPEPNPADNTDTATVTVTAAPSADIGVTVSGSPDPVGAGFEATYSIMVTNNGPIDTGVFLNANVPDNTTFVSLSTVPGWSCKTPGPGGTGSIGCSTQLLASGQSVTFDLVVLVDSGTAIGTVLTCSASVEGNLPDPNTNNNTASGSVTVGNPTDADLVLLKSSTPDSVVAGGTLTYSLEITNNGPAAAMDVVVTDPMASLTTFVSASASAGGSVTAPTVGQTGTVTCTWAGPTAAGETRTLTIVTTASTSPSQTTTIANTATVSSSSPDPDLSNNTSTRTNTIEVDQGQPRADVGVSMTGGTGEIVTGTFVEYSIAVSNNGPNDADEVVVMGSTPIGTRLVSLSTPQGSVDGPPVGGSGSFTVSIGTIESHHTVTVSLVVNVLAPGGSSVNNSVAVSSSTNDPNGANNTSDTMGTVTAGMDTLLTWDPPIQTTDDSLNPPLHLQTRPVTANNQGFTGQLPKLLRNSLVGYNVYRSNQSNVQATPANLFTTVGPGVTMLVAGTAPSGSYFTVTAQYPNGESGATNAASGGLPQPAISGIQFRAGKLIVNGADFSDTVSVFVDGIPFAKTAKVKRAGTKIQQKGKLLTGQTVQAYISGQGGVALISVLNEDSGIGTFLYRR